MHVAFVDINVAFVAAFNAFEMNPFIETVTEATVPK